MGTKLTAKDYAINSVQALVKGVPYVGGSLEQFIFGPLQELRMRRIEATLKEVALALGPEGSKRIVQEQFVHLLQSIAEPLCRTTDEGKRARFRDLLTNAGRLTPGDAKWTEATLAGDLLNELDTPALAILAGIARCQGPLSNRLTITSSPVSQVFEGEYRFEAPGNPQHVLPYDWIVVDYWARALKDKRLIDYNSHDVRGAFGGVGLAALGEFLISWTIMGEKADE